ncbi:MAG: nuclear transport factor 2 family protein [Actinobacteria bacterium]|nr:nuclear transport factor 2 family protein [Actinomycetota bacterium]
MADEHRNVTIAREGLDALARGDTQWLQDHLADDVVWHVGGNSAAAGEYRGKDSVLQFMGAAAQTTMDIDTHDILGNDDHVVTLGTNKVTAPDGDSIEYKFVNVFHIQDNKIASAWGMSENDAETDAFFGKMAQGMPDQPSP